jgi:glucose-6-phosphate isomerase
MERMPISEVEGSLHELRAWGQSKPLSFLDLPFTGELATASLREAQRLKQSCDTLLVLGIGGSSLGTQAIASALGHTLQPRKRAVFADNIDPDHFFALVEGLDFAKTAVFIVSKSGSTVETWTQWLAIESQVTAIAKWQSRVVCCTDNESGALRSFARAHDLPLLPIPGNVGGRFSVLSPVGLFPAAFLSVDPQNTGTILLAIVA